MKWYDNACIISIIYNLFHDYNLHDKISLPKLKMPKDLKKIKKPQNKAEQLQETQGKS